MLHGICRQARLVLVTSCALSLGFLSGCISYRSTGAVTAPPKALELTGSHIPVNAASARAAAAETGSSTVVYSSDDIARSGAQDLAGVLDRIPSARVHR